MAEQGRIDKSAETYPTRPPDEDTLPITRVVRRETNTVDADDLTEQPIRLTIGDEQKEFALTQDEPVIIGRSEPDSDPDIDLNPYGAQESGVSRKHLQFHLYRGQTYVTDLGSANGSYLNRQRLPPHDPVGIRDGDHLLLGRLMLYVELA